MLHYLEFGLSYVEVPGETALCIYISGCMNRCANCHYPEMQQADLGELLSEYFEQILDLYHETYTTCVCFMGEGDGSKESREELLQYVQRSNDKGYKCCLYSGRDTTMEEWMQVFHYVKLGSYREEYGPLTNAATNQKLFMRKAEGKFENITDRFWSKEGGGGHE